MARCRRRRDGGLAEATIMIDPKQGPFPRLAGRDEAVSTERPATRPPRGMRQYGLRWARVQGRWVRDRWTTEARHRDAWGRVGPARRRPHHGSTARRAGSVVRGRAAAWTPGAAARPLR
jgi:hypothetical protein